MRFVNACKSIIQEEEEEQEELRSLLGAGVNKVSVRRTTKFIIQHMIVCVRSTHAGVGGQFDVESGVLCSQGDYRGGAP